MLHDAQMAFARYALTREDDPAGAAGFLAPGGEIAPDDRLSIHRNNVMGSLIEALGDTFPVVADRCGRNNFEAAAAAFVRAAPPDRAQLSHYGADFPAFLDGYAPARRDLPFLADLARLEWALNEAYFAAEAVPLGGDDLAALPPDRLAEARLWLHPATRLVSAGHPIYRLWRDGADGTPLPGDGRFVLVVRPDAVVEAVPVGAGDHALLTALAAGDPLGASVEAAAAADDAFDFQASLASHLMRGTFCRVAAPPAG